MRVLVVDDEPCFRMTLALSLRVKGFDVDTAEDGDAAIAKIAAGDYEWVVSDIRMPGCDGFTLAARAKALKPDMRIVLVSAYCPSDDVRYVAVEGFFEKPVDMEELTQVLRAV